MSQTTSQLAFREKAGYGLGDASANFVFQLLIYFQTVFYIDVMGIDTVALGMMLLLVRVSDAVTDPLMGILADRTKHPWGRFRPWLLWSAIPFALLFWVAFTVPEGMSDNGKVAYAAVTYAVLMMAYTMNNVPYSALMGVMTDDPNERTSIASFRFVAGISAGFIVQGFTLPLVDKLGDGDAAKGWSMTVGIYACAAVLFFVIAFFATKERVHPPKGQKPDIKQDFKDLSGNKPWFAMFAMVTFVFTTLALRGGSYNMYFNQYVDSAALTDYVRELGFFASDQEMSEGGFRLAALDLFGLVVKPGGDPASVGFSLFNMIGNLTMIAGILAAKPLATRFGKKNIFTIGLAGATVAQFSFWFLAPEAVPTMFLLSILSSAAYGPTVPLLWAMMGDVADYSEWKTHRRSTGFIFAGLVFALKLGLGIGGACTAWLLAAYGYNANVTPSSQVLGGIRMMASVYSGVPFGLGVVCMLFYPISKGLNLQITRDLVARRKAAGPPDEQAPPIAPAPLADSPPSPA